MKLAPLLGLLMLPLAAFGRETAYQALRVLGAERDQALLNRVVAVKGRNGNPQPVNWVIVLDDPMARGGVREIEVSEGRIVSERTPVRAYSGSAVGVTMDFQKLNLDSQGAFTLAEQAAREARVAFNSLDYVLRRDDPHGAPVWHVELLDGKKRSVGSLTIGADNGTVLARSFDAPVEPTVESEERAVEESGEHLGRRIDRTFRRIGGSLEEFFTGKRTIDRNVRDD